MLKVPVEIATTIAPLLEALPLEHAMGTLLGSAPKLTGLVTDILDDPILANRAELAAGLWLYVDDLDRSHTVSQSLDDATGAYWHAIMHRREGDYSNSRYWMRRAAGHPLLQSKAEHAADSLIDQVALIDFTTAARGVDDPALVQRQRDEWQALFEWCAANR